MFHGKIRVLGRGGGAQKTNTWWDCLKRGSKKEGGGVFDVGVDTPMHTMLIMIEIIIWLK